MKKFVFLVFNWVLIGMAFAQQKPLIIQQEGGKLFLHHSVVPKENWYSIGRLYNVSPKDIAAFNNTKIDIGLAIGQSLKIPLSSTNFIQSGKPEADEVVVPLYHTVKDKEGLYRIGQTYNKVPVEQIKSWNKLTSDELQNGKELIVGYLKVKKELSPLAKGGQTVVPPPAVVQKEVKPADKPAEKTKEAETKIVEKKEIPPPDIKQNPPAKPDEPKTVRSEPVPNATPVVAGAGGAFKSLFDEQSHSGDNLQNVSGKAAAFKSTSGWKDGKYYVLMNKTQPGTVVKIINPVNRKFVYAKVLGEIPPIKENEGLLLRISNAATTELLMDEGRYEVQVTWTKQ
jgi:LysM repeat protein